ncbi:hypothetical protein IJ765_01050 [Candidatus Saccharibacteria bacterium]|nr:hypothetical protein [Candidatus Saccharibacteria bacterium]
MDKINRIFRQLRLFLKRRLTRERVVFLVIAGSSMYFIGFAITSMARNWSLEQTLAEKNRAKALLELEVETISLENKYYASNEYQELSARLHQNKMAAGETMIYLPKNSDYAKNKHKEEQKASSAEERPSNFSQWVSFLLGI